MIDEVEELLETDSEAWARENEVDLEDEYELFIEKAVGHSHKF
jgi:hypothetical protein